MEDLNKTIVVTYDEISRMQGFCTNDDGEVTRDFMDWYVNESSFFSKTGMLITDDILKESNKKFAVAFDFNNPDYAEFVLYDYHTQKEMCKYSFSRKNNLAMEHIKTKIKWFDKKAFKSSENTFSSKELNIELDDFESKLRKTTRIKKPEYKKLKRRHGVLEKQLDIMYFKIASFMAEQGVYFTYATMYYFAKNKSKEIIGLPKKDLLNNGIGQQINAIYKYTGYVNINDTKIYKPIIKKDKNEPSREYGRHIEKWSVRGHYRRVNGKTMWIEPHEKGEGNLEKRVYGTEKESEVNIIPKVFEVTRTVYDSDMPVKESIKINSKRTKTDPKTIKKHHKPLFSFLQNITTFWQQITSYFSYK